jgi:hypothetical protein
MALQAVGWLSKSLGINIAGRSDEAAAASASPPVPQDDTNYFGVRQAPQPSALNLYMSTVSEMMFGGASGQSKPDQQRSVQASRGDVVEQCEVDEQGLPVARNWYYYDQALGRWNVAPDAPEPIKREFAERLRLEEEERSGNKAALAPPPPPPPPPPPMSPFGPPGGTARSPVTPQYAMPSYFQTTTGPSTVSAFERSGSGPHHHLSPVGVAPFPAPPVCGPPSIFTPLPPNSA